MAWRNSALVEYLYTILQSQLSLCSIGRCAPVGYVVNFAVRSGDDKGQPFIGSMVGFMRSTRDWDHRIRHRKFLRHG